MYCGDSGLDYFNVYNILGIIISFEDTLSETNYFNKLEFSIWVVGLCIHSCHGQLLKFSVKSVDVLRLKFLTDAVIGIIPVTYLLTPSLLLEHRPPTAVDQSSRSWAALSSCFQVCPIRLKNLSLGW